MIWSISSGGRVIRAACWCCCCSEDMVVWRDGSIFVEQSIVLTGMILIVRMRDGDFVQLIDYM